MFPTFSGNHLRRGERAEQKAARFLRRQGLKILFRNYHCRQGEIDLIALENRQQLVFVEVRLRQNLGFGSAADSVDWRKQRKLRFAAEQFLSAHCQYHKLPARFDVIAIEQDGNGRCTNLEWIRNAFM